MLDPEQFTEDETIEYGQQAKRLLQDEFFNLAMNAQFNDFVAKIIQSNPHEAKTREDNYYRVKGLEEFRETLLNFAQHSDYLLEQRNNGDNE